MGKKDNIPLKKKDSFISPHKLSLVSKKLSSSSQKQNTLMTEPKSFIIDKKPKTTMNTAKKSPLHGNRPSHILS
jgi:hypothetical protein